MAGLHRHLSQTKCRSNSTDKSAGLFSWSAIGQLRTNMQPIGATSTPHHRTTIKGGEYPGNGTNKKQPGLAGPLQARTPRALQTSPKDVTSEGTRTLERDPGGANRHVDSQRWGHTRREPSGPTDTSTHSGGDTLGRDPDGANNTCYLIVHTRTHVIRLVYVCE